MAESKNSILHQRLQRYIQQSILFWEKMDAEDNKEDPSLKEEIKSEIDNLKLIQGELEFVYIKKACGAIYDDLANKASSISKILAGKTIEWNELGSVTRGDKKYSFPRKLVHPRWIHCKGLGNIISEYILWALLDRRGMTSFEDYWHYLEQEKRSNVDILAPRMVLTVTKETPTRKDIGCGLEDRTPLFSIVSGIAHLLGVLILCPGLDESEDFAAQEEDLDTFYERIIYRTCKDLKIKGTKGRMRAVEMDKRIPKCCEHSLIQKNGGSFTAYFDVPSDASGEGKHTGQRFRGFINGIKKKYEPKPEPK